MTVIGTPRSFYKKFKFRVEIDGFASSAFQDCSELSAEVAVTEQWEGGAMTPDKSPGRLTYADVTLSRGTTTNTDIADWFEEVANAAADSGLVDPAYKRMVEIVQLDRDGTELGRKRLYEAWPNKYVAGDWDNTSDDNVIEKLTLSFQFFQSV